MSRGKRYNNEPKLNVKKVLAVIIAIVVIIMFVITIKKLLTTSKGEENKTAQSYYTVYTNDKWGVINSKGNIIIDASFSDMIVIPDSKTDIFICMYDVDYENNTYKTKVLNSKHKEIFKEYEMVEAIENLDKDNNLWYESGVLKVKKDGKYGLISFSGDEILKPEYTEITALKGIKNSLIINKDNKLGLCDNNGTVIIEPLYKEIRKIGEDYKNGYIVITDDNKYGLIDFDKKTILEAKYEEIKPIICKDTYVVKDEGKLKVINNKAETLVENKFDDVKEIANNNLVFIKNKKYGIMGIDSEIKVNPQYEEISYLFSDYYIAKNNGKYGVIDISGEKRLDFNYTSLSYIKEAGIILAETDGDINTEILDNKFKLRLQGIISEIDTDKGYIRIRVNDKYKYYNFKFEEKKSSEVLTTNNLFLSKKDGKYGYINKDGNVVVDYIYEDATEQNKNGFVSVKKDGKWGALDKDGKEVVETKYELNNNLIIDFIGKWHIAEDINSNYYTDK